MVGVAIAAICDFARLPIPGGVLDLAGTILAVNEASELLAGRKPTQIVGRKAWEIAPGADLIWPELLAQAHEHGVYRGEIAIATPGGPRQLYYVLTLREHDGKSYALVFALEVASATAR